MCANLSPTLFSFSSLLHTFCLRTNPLSVSIHISNTSNHHQGEMGKILGPLICLLIVILDIVAGILGIEAEIAQNKKRHLKFLLFECKEPSHEAFKLGLAAACLLAAAHAIANLLGGCLCICSKEELDTSSANKQLTTASLVISWILLIVGFSMLMVGAMSNSKSRSSCGFSHRRLLSIGGILCFVHGLICVVFYVSATATQREETRGYRERNRGPMTHVANRAEGH